MKRITFVPAVIILLLISLVACGKADMEGIVLHADENTLLVVENLAMDRYIKIKEEASSYEDLFDAMMQEQRNTEGDIRLIDLTYDDSIDFNAGDEVEVWIGRHIGESSPLQAEARKIALKK